MEQQFSERITLSSKSVRDSIPVDLLMDIFSRVPAKSIGRFRCVSKFWESIIGRPDFTELFLTKSVARPLLFFALEVNKELLVFSTPQPQNPYEHSSLVATPYKAFPKYFPPKFCVPLNGSVFLQNRGRKTRVICNPLTGESLTLPEPEVKATTGVVQCHFGFDPIKKQFKVLCTTWSSYGTPNTHWVLTLETGTLLWRRIQNNQLLPTHCVTGCYNEICIDGVVYYGARFAKSMKIVCFDFRYERFGLVNMDEDMLHVSHLTLFNYKGHLGAFWYKTDCVFWVLEDAGKHKWSKHLREVLFLSGRFLNEYNFVGMTRTGELVFSPYDLSNSFSIFYWSNERNTFTEFKIKGFEEFKHQHIVVHTFLDYVENIKLM